MNFSLLDSTVADRDRFFWEAVCNWSNDTSVNPVIAGIDYSELTRCFLWDKVARSIRAQHPERFAFEQVRLKPVADPIQPHPNRLKFGCKQALSRFAAWQDIRSLPTKNSLYVPCWHPTLHTVVRSLAESFTVVTPQASHFSQLPTIHPIRLPLSADSPNLSQVESLHHGIITGLKQQGIELIQHDVIELRSQIAQLLLRTEQIEAELSLLRPKAILLFADNHFPVQSYVLVGRKLGIPTIMTQHGLDCEQYCLEEAYADYISVWGVSRLQRYQTRSSGQPIQLQVNGNPDYDGLTPPTQMDRSGSYWLWATRPHAPEKCYLPSRHPQEGIEILNALLMALSRLPNARLVIKPHPLDDVTLYQSTIDQHSARHRVLMSSDSVRSLLPEASVVISEDSTVGLEAMFFGKIVVHAHFAASEPVMPFVKYQAALPGYTAEMLRTTLENLEQVTEAQAKQLFAGQCRLIQDFAGDCDGQALKRVTAMIQRILEQ
ncbi:MULTISPECIES: hypothetical protein [Leptolyngbya]|uniref:capsular polysaccharide export protein, LipB/KpsS family n=1 Tax=Leptolyngbya TaxID=47251 RepID=UPI00168452CC|nr:hypothetical protein [Leptolyngbya sp. FACHB-1624]MBD1856057.1 hypothetical protein [Leptolyngbya sp. FACHB-1624]